MAYGVPPAPEAVVGVLSLIMWSLLLVVGVKYLYFVLRAAHEGEGGVLALATLVGAKAGHRRPIRLAIAAGVVGAALFYGDAVLTPAVSVLGAVEGIGYRWPAIAHLELAVGVAILIALFSVQQVGSSRIGALFGPVMVVWFASLALLGIRSIVMTPEILAAVDPSHAVHFLVRGDGSGALVLGGVFLVVTGGEALYADLGHFGSRPIRRAWWGLVFPALTLCYLGQGALLIREPAAVANPFFGLASEGWTVPLLVLASLAAIIAAQAVLAGAFSVSRQAQQLGFLPRLEIRHVDSRIPGQVYLPAVDVWLLVGTLAVTLLFRSADSLAGAYGLAVAATMFITTVLFLAYVRVHLGWTSLTFAGFAILFVSIDVAFLAMSTIKVADGAWIVLVIAGLTGTLMAIWRRGRLALARRHLLRRSANPDPTAVVDDPAITRIPGTAVFLDSRGEGMPRSLLRFAEHTRALHEVLVLLHVETLEVPRVARADRLRISHENGGIVRLGARFGFMETPDLPAALRSAVQQEFLTIDPAHVTYFLGHETLVTRPGVGRWWKRVFATLARNAASATTHFRLPSDQVVVIGEQIEI